MAICSLPPRVCLAGRQATFGFLEPEPKADSLPTKACHRTPKTATESQSMPLFSLSVYARALHV